MSLGANERLVETDVLVVGGGMAGMFAAIKAREQGLDVTLTDKGYVGKSGSTAYAEGDILFFRKAKDNLQEWVDIISKRVEYLNNRTWDEICLTEAEDRYNDLVSYGVEFYEKDGKQYKWDTSAVGAPPSVYQDITMRAGKYAPTLRKKVLELGVRVLDNVMMIELLKQGGAVAGAVGFHVRGGGLFVIQAGATVISTGTMSFKHDTSPTYFWTGDGEAMAYRAGAEISGREFNNGYLYGRRELQHVMQTLTGEVSGEIVDSSYQHPYALGGGYSGWYSRPTLNSEGGAVITPAWEAHMGRAPLYLDCETIPPKKWEWLREYFKRIPIAWEQGDKIEFDVFRGGKVRWPSSRMQLGSTLAGCGIWAVDTDCASGVPGLYSAGNTSATMGSGAVYAGMGFGSNHAMVTGTRAGTAAAKFVTQQKRGKLDAAEVARARDFVRAPLERKGGFGPGWVTQVIQSITVPYFYLGVKHADRLAGGPHHSGVRERPLGAQAAGHRRSRVAALPRDAQHGAGRGDEAARLAVPHREPGRPLQRGLSSQGRPGLAGLGEDQRRPGRHEALQRAGAQGMVARPHQALRGEVSGRAAPGRDAAPSGCAAPRRRQSGRRRVMSIELVDPELCNGCGLCVITCPLDVIRLDTEVADREEHPDCRRACPAGVDVRSYMYLLKNGQVDEALEVLREYLPLPAVTGRVCPHPCESECARREVDEAVNINALERFVADRWLSEKARPARIRSTRRRWPWWAPARPGWPVPTFSPVWATR